MPRIANHAIARAQRLHPYLALLLRPCRDLDSARNELRWLREYTKNLRARRQPKAPAPPRLWDLCKERSRGRPLQYILGSQPFGELEILCRKGVLIPRPETEATTRRFANVLAEAWQKTPQQPLTILDIGTGSGCIALLLYSLLHKSVPNLRIFAADISSHALQTTRKNLEHNIALGLLPANARSAIQIVRLDVTSKTSWKEALGEDGSGVNIIVSNPPYISTPDLRLKTERSVRLYEPRAALVGEPAVYNYLHASIAKLAKWLDVSAMLVEIDSRSQALALLTYWWSLTVQNSAHSTQCFDVWNNHAESEAASARTAAGDSPDLTRASRDQTRAVFLCKSEFSAQCKDSVMARPLDMQDADRVLGMPQKERRKVIWLSAQKERAEKNAAISPDRLTETSLHPTESNSIGPVTTELAKQERDGTSQTRKEARLMHELKALEKRVGRLEKREVELLQNIRSLWQEHQQTMEALTELMRFPSATGGSSSDFRRASQLPEATVRIDRGARSQVAIRYIASGA